MWKFLKDSGGGVLYGKSRDVEQHFKANSSFRQICSGFDPRMTGLKPIFAISARVFGLFHFSTHRKYASSQYLQFPKKSF